VIAKISMAQTKQQTQGLFASEDFKFDPNLMKVTCPNGKETRRYKEKKGKNGHDFCFT